MQARAQKQKPTAPLSIYELHLGSWQCELDEAGEVSRQYGWRELAERLIPYVQQLGFTHIELMPIMEHPFGGSWGYQALSAVRADCALRFAAGIRLVRQCLSPGRYRRDPRLGAGAFPTDAHGLAQFDGTALYEYANPLEGFHQDWDTLIYNLGRTEVHGFMLASALHWLKHFHVDGLRVDAVASMLYRDYSRKAGEWVPNRHGGRGEPRSHRLPAALERRGRPRSPRRAGDRRRIHGLAGRQPADPTGRPGLQLQVEHGLDDTIPCITSSKTRCTAPTITMN